MSAFTNQAQSTYPNIINYIRISPIESYLPKDYVKLIFEENYCQIDIQESTFITHKKYETKIETETEAEGIIEQNDIPIEENIYYIGIMKINKWHDTDLANELIDKLICDMSYTMPEYGWIIEKYDPTDSDTARNIGQSEQDNEFYYDDYDSYDENYDYIDYMDQTND
jgi:hypothetical protein